MGLVSSSQRAAFLEIKDEVIQEECDTTRLFPKAQFYNCSINDALFSYKIPLKVTEDIKSFKREYALVSKTRNQLDNYKMAAGMSRFSVCHNFLRYGRSFVCNSPKAMTKLGCERFGGSAYFTLTSSGFDHQGKLMSKVKLSKEDLRSITFQACYTSEELKYLDLGISFDPEDVMLFDLPEGQLLTYGLANGKIYSFESKYFAIFKILDQPSNDLAHLWHKMANKTCAKVLDSHFKQWEGSQVVPCPYYLDENVVPESMLGKFFAISSQAKYNAIQTSNRLLSNWSRHVDDFVDVAVSNPELLTQDQIQYVESKVISIGHPNITQVLMTLNKVISKSKPAEGDSRVTEIVRKIFNPDFKGERLLALGDLAKLYLRSRETADGLINAKILEKLKKELSRTSPSDYQKSKDAYVREKYAELVKYGAPDELLSVIKPFVNSSAYSPLIYGSAEWRERFRPEPITVGVSSPHIASLLTQYVVMSSSLPELKQLSVYSNGNTNLPASTQSVHKPQLTTFSLDSNPPTRFDSAFVMKSSKLKPNLERLEAFENVVRENQLYGPRYDEDAVTGSDAQAEREFIAELNYAVAEKLKGNAVYDFEPCSLPFAQVGYCFDVRGNKVDKGITRPLMPQLSGSVDVQRPDTIGYRAAKFKAQKIKLAEIMGTHHSKISDSQARNVDVTDAEIAKVEVQFEPLFEKVLVKMGYKLITEEIAPTELKPIQTEMLGAKIANMYSDLVLADSGNEVYVKDAQNVKDPIFTSGGYVIDGHHRWAALFAYDIANGKGTVSKMKSRTILKGDGRPVPIEEMIMVSNAFQHAVGIINQNRDGNAHRKDVSPEELELSNRIQTLI